MKNVLVYATGLHGCQEASMLEEAIRCENEGSNVLYITCSERMGICVDNPYISKSFCKQCKYHHLNRAKKYIHNVKTIDDFYTDKIDDIISHITFDYSSTKEIRSIIYEGIQIGYGALSTFISLTRNMEPNLKDLRIREYIDYLLKSQVKLILLLNNAILEFKPDEIYFHNGRYAQFKPIYGLALKYGINFVSTETFVYANGDVRKNNYVNDIPHSIKANDIKYKEFWESNRNDIQRETIAKSFFENRRYGKYAGDKIYTKDQQYGLLPANLDKTQYNIVIFNSSEDEYCSISEEVDRSALFESQLKGIKTIIEKYLSDKTIHFYLRVHPNLKNVSYSYHLDIYKLKYPNLTIIPADSKISSYTLLDIADKVIVFGSTMGVEASYWKKPVINLAYALYSLMDVVYIPKSKDELWDLIDNRNLAMKSNDNHLKYGYYYMSENQPKYNYVNIGFKHYYFRGKRYQVLKNATIGGSNFLYLLFYTAFNKTYKLFTKYSFLK